MELEVQETYWGETSETKGNKSRMESLQTKYRSDISERREVRKNWLGKDLDYNIALRNSWPG